METFDFTKKVHLRFHFCSSESFKFVHDKKHIHNHLVPKIGKLLEASEEPTVGWLFGIWKGHQQRPGHWKALESGLCDSVKWLENPHSLKM